MNASPLQAARRLAALVFVSATLSAPALWAAAAPATPAPAAGVKVAPPYTGTAYAVAISEDQRTWTLNNGIVAAVVDKRTGNLLNLFYKGTDRLGHEQGTPGVWEQNPSAAEQVGGLTQSITIDPAKNNGERGEVSVKGVSKGEIGLSPSSPGQGAQGTVNLDLEIRYTLGRGDSGVYTYAIFSHPESYGALNVPESRYIVRPSQRFDWLSVDADRNLLACAPLDWGTGVVVHAKEQRIMSQGVYKNSVEHKYSYNAVQYRIPAYGWSSTADHVGIWFINPTIEYLSGGATKQELVCHFGDNGNPTPIILNYWRGTHYGGGASASVPAGENWSKVIGPMMIYVNSLEDFKTPSQNDLDVLAKTSGNPTVPAAWKDNATALWQDALAQAKKENGKWPYAWVEGVDYPHKDQRGNVTGQLVLNDPLAPSPMTKFSGITVGLAHPMPGDFPNPNAPQAGGFGGFGGGPRDWVHDAKYYQFWNDGTEDGKFTITNVRPGQYTLHAFATGVLGEFAQANITVEAGKTLDLGKIEWKPVRYGTQLWDIGYPDRTGGKFFKGDGDNYWLWGWGLRYPLLFPNDVTYTIGKSDYRKDWFFQQTPRSNSQAWINPDAKDPANQRFGWLKAESLEQYPQTDTQGPWRVYGRGDACTWTIKFNMDKAPQGSAVFRISLAGADGPGATIAVNGQDVGGIRPTGTNALRYNTNKAIWQERSVTFDASLLKKGENSITITVPAGELTSGLVYDYLRLELNEHYKPDGTPIAAVAAR